MPHDKQVHISVLVSVQRSSSVTSIILQPPGKVYLLTRLCWPTHFSVVWYLSNTLVNTVFFFQVTFSDHACCHPTWTIPAVWLPDRPVWLLRGLRNLWASLGEKENKISEICRCCLLMLLSSLWIRPLRDVLPAVPQLLHCQRHGRVLHMGW